jgi:pSer/pThr/pTyr-binding forkhead associated (FHA) protein
MTTLRVLEGPGKGKNFELEEDIIFVGRGAKNHVQIADDTVSRMHLKIFSIGTALFVEDLKSSNGTLINGTLVEPGEGHQIDGEDIITMGDTVFQLEDLISPKDLDLEELSPKPSRKASTSLLHSEQSERRSRSFRETEFISRLSEFLQGPQKLAEALEQISEQLLDMLPRIDRVAVFVRDKETGGVKQGAMKTKPGREPVPFSHEAVQEAFDEGRTVTVADATARRTGDAAHDRGTMEIKSLLCVPMSAHGRVFGVLYLDGIEGPYAYRKEDLLWIETLGALLAYAIENAELASRMSVIAGLSTS